MQAGNGNGTAEESIRAVLDGLRATTKHDDPVAGLDASEVKAILDDACSTTSDAFAELPGADAGRFVDVLRRLSRVDQQISRHRTAQRIGKVLTRLETAPCSVRALVDLAPTLVCELGLDRSFISRVDDGLWISEVVCVPGDPKWAQAINTAGQQHPQPLVPELMESELVRRRQPIVVHDVQNSPRVHRAIAEESRSRSYVAAPITSSNRVVGMLHADYFMQGREIDDADAAMLTSFACALQLALSRARIVEHVQAIGDTLTGAATDLATTLTGAQESFFAKPPGPRASTVAAEPRRARPTDTGGPVRGLLTRRELEVLELVALGRTNAAIASRLVISEGTVKQHVKHILRKLRVENRAEAVSRLYQSANH